MQTAIGGRGTLFGPLVGAAVWLFLQDFLQATLKLGSTWKLVLGVVFVLLVCFLHQGIIGGIKDLYTRVTRGKAKAAVDPDAAVSTDGLDAKQERDAASTEERSETSIASLPARHHASAQHEGPILKATGLTKHYGGVIANSNIDFTVNAGEIRGIIGPNGAGKSTFFKMLTCEVPPTSGRIEFEGRDITGMSVTDVCQLGLTKSYQVNQLFNKLTVRENVTIAALAELRGRMKLDMLRDVESVPGLKELVGSTLELVHLTGRIDTPVAQLAYGEKRRLEVGLALASTPSLLLLDEPLAGMSPRERVETVSLLRRIARGRTLIIIDHDMDALFELAERVTVLQEGRVLVEGTPAEIKSNAQVQEAYLGGVHEGAAA
jgi:branched-chain amino acid transport system permease protein